MAHVIIFADRAPEQRHRFGEKLNSIRYTYSAGPYKIASVLRQKGFEVLVVSSCLNLTFKSIKSIIKNNSKNLLWVGISTSLLQSHSPNYNIYRQQWQESAADFVNPGLMFETIYDLKKVKFEMPWADKEIRMISEFLKPLNVPLIMGGSYVTRVLNGGIMTPLDSNTYVVRGNAEQWVIDFTLQKSNDSNASPHILNNNTEYDSIHFKSSTIDWEVSDLIDKDDWLPIEVARGCAFNCAYCNYEHKGKFDLYKKPEVLLAEFIRNYEKFGVTKYMLVDDLYNDSKEKVRILYDEVWSKLPFNVEWTSYMRLDMFWADPESIEIIKASGARYGTLGIETLHNAAGRKVGKGLGRERIIETLHNLKNSWKDDVLVNGQFIAGLPEEPEEHIRETMQWTITTDLLHSVTWAPLFISPNANWRHDDVASTISKDNNKFGITWEGRVWKNNLGMTFTLADQLVKEYYETKDKSYRVHFGNYGDLRIAGLTHEQIVSLPKNKTDINWLEQLGDNLGNKVLNRLNKIIHSHESC